MNLDGFIAERRDDWSELESLIGQAGRRPERLGPDRVRRLGALYRAAAADLAVARRRYVGDPVVTVLESLVGRSRHLVYDTEIRRTSVRAFFATGYWRRIRERPMVLLVAVAMTAAPAALGYVWAQHDPAGAGGLVPGGLRSAGSARRSGADLGLPLATRSQFAAQIFTNNIRVTLLAFAGGMTGGLLTGWLLLFNGLLLGVVGGLAASAGTAGIFVQLVVPHGVLEISCIIVSGVAGLRVGWAIVAPGRLSRGEALVRQARVAVELALGTAPWLVLAGLVEGFVTPAGFGLAIDLSVGLGLGAVYWTLVVTRGRPEITPAPAPSSAGTP